MTLAKSCGQKRPIITVDGLAGSGKSTLARLLSEKLNFAHLNSGLLYRSVAWLATSKGIHIESEDAIAGLIRQHSFQLTSGGEGAAILIDGNVVDPATLQLPAISEATSKVAVYQQVRSALVKPQREAFPGRGLVAEGRDMGTIIFPDAGLKFFIEADQSVRIARRLAQLKAAKGQQCRQKDVEIEIIERDKRDRERILAPAVAASDAVIIDNSSVSLTDVIERMYTHALSRGLARDK